MKILSWDVGIINLSYCILEKNEMGIKILQWGIINLMETPEMKKNRNLLFENIPKKLHELPYLLNVDKVVIENQPSLKNPQMKSIQMIVYSYFLMYGKVLNINENKIMDIDFCNASNKLKVYKGPEIILVKKIKKEKKVDAKLQNIIEIQGGSTEEIIIDNKIDEEDAKEDSKDKKAKEKKSKSPKLSYGDKKKCQLNMLNFF